MRHYSKCLEDIEAALMFGYPEDMQYKLMDRRGRCLLRCHRLYEAQEALEVASLLVQKSKLSAEDKLKFKQEIKNSMNESVEQSVCEESNLEGQRLIMDFHPCIPGLSSKLEVGYDTRRGRHCLAAQEVSAGEAVCVDIPVTWCLSHNYSLTHCHHCCRSLNADLGGCSGGYPSPLSRQETVLFCSLSCLQVASTSYHRHEAALPLSSIFRIEGAGATTRGRGGGFDEISGAVMMAVRAITQKKLQFFTETDWLSECKESHVPQEVCDDDDILYKYRALFNMVSHHESRSEVDLLSTTMKTVFILQLLSEIHYCNHERDSERLGPIIFHLLEVIQYNSHPIDMVTGDIDPSTNVNLVEIGSAVYPSLAMVCNHSCDPSTIRLSRGRELRMFARQAEDCETKVEWLRTTFGKIIPTHILPAMFQLN